MTGKRGSSRLLAACDACNTVYEAITVSEDRIQPIGSRKGCGSCGGAEFTPVTRSSESPDFRSVVADD